MAKKSVYFTEEEERNLFLTARVNVITEGIQAKKASDLKKWIIQQVVYINEQVVYYEEEIRQYDEISKERDLSEWEKRDYNEDMAKWKAYNGMLHSWSFELWQE